MFCPHASLEWWPHITCLYLFVLNIAEQKMFSFSWFIAISTEKNENKNVALSFEVSSRGHHVLFSLSRNEHRVLQKIYFLLITSWNVSLYFKESLVINEKIPEVWIKYLLIWHSYWYHCGFLEHWNSQKSLTKIRQCFSCLLDEGIEKICKKKFTMDFWDNPIYPVSHPDGQDRGLIFIGGKVNIFPKKNQTSCPFRLDIG